MRLARAKRYPPLRTFPQAPIPHSLSSASRATVPMSHPTESAETRARGLLNQIKELGLRAKLERSFRMAEGLILPNRLLITFPKPQLGPDPLARLIPIGQALHLPLNFQDEVGRYLTMTSFVHLGFEEDPTRSLYKLYLEFASHETALESLQYSDPLPRYIAFKWNPDDPSVQVVSRYLCYPGLTSRALFDRVDALFASKDLTGPHEVAREIVRLTLGRLAADQIQYLEVIEPGNLRRSFDLNIYDAGLKVADLEPTLRKLSRHLKIPPATFASVFDHVSRNHLGHVAGGLHRSGKPFFTIYHNEYVVPKADVKPPPRPTFVPVRPSSPLPALPVSVPAPKWIEWTKPDDGYRNYCLWRYNATRADRREVPARHPPAPVVRTRRPRRRGRAAHRHPAPPSARSRPSGA